jgi:transposase
MFDIPGPPGDAAGLRAANARLRKLVAERDAEIAALRARVAEAEGLVADLREQAAELAARVGQNSANSSKPPSPDGLGKPAPRSLREKTGRKPGRPKGQPGATMQVADHPDRVVRHEPSCCAGCDRGLGGAGEAGVIRRQVTEIPLVKAKVTEHQMIGRLCICGTVTWGRAPEGVTAPVQYGPRMAALGVYLWHGQFLEQEAAHRGRQRLVHVFTGVECGQDKHPGGRSEGQGLPGGLQAVHDRHPDVGQGHRGAVPAHELDRLPAVTRLGCNRYVRLGLQDHGQAAAHHALVIGDDDGDRPLRSPVGIWAAARRFSHGQLLGGAGGPVTNVVLGDDP